MILSSVYEVGSRRPQSSATGRHACVNELDWDPSFLLGVDPPNRARYAARNPFPSTVTDGKLIACLEAEVRPLCSSAPDESAAICLVEADQPYTVIGHRAHWGVRPVSRSRSPRPSWSIIIILSIPLLVSSQHWSVIGLSMLALLESASNRFMTWSVA